MALGLGAPLDVLVVRKLGLPGHEELAVGAIASGGAIVVNREVVDRFDVPEHAIREAAEREQVELHRREAAYRDGRPMRPLAGRTVIVVDDGLATGSTMRAAVIAVRALGPARVIVGVPVGATSTCEEIADVADHVVCTTTPWVSVWSIRKTISSPAVISPETRCAAISFCATFCPMACL